MGPVLPILAVAGSVASAGASVYQGYAASANAQYQAQVARNNATIARQNADYAMKSGEQQAQMVQLRGASIAGGIKNAQGGSGVNVNSGSYSDVRQSQELTSTLDTATTINNAELKSYGYRTQATNFEAQAKLDEAEADQDVTAGWIKGGASMLTNASSLASGWGSMSSGVSSFFDTPIASSGHGIGML